MKRWDNKKSGKNSLCYLFPLDVFVLLTTVAPTVEEG